MTMLNKFKAVGYIRVSTRRQARQGFSLSSQRRGIEEYAALKGLTVNVFEDAGISGATTSGRPALQNVLNYIRFDTGVKYLIVFRLDRLSRRADDMLQIADMCLNHGVQIVSLSESLSGNPNMMKSQIGIYGAIAEFQRSIIRENVMLGSAKRFEAGLPLSLKLPIGYKLDEEGRVAIDEVTAPLVVEMFGKYTNGVGYRRLADWLTGKIGYPISFATISTMLENTHYIGLSENVYGTSWDVYPAIVNMKMFNAAQGRRLHTKPQNRVSRKGDLLYQKLLCPVCQHRLGLNVTTIKRRQYCYYYCSMGKNVANQAQRHTFRLKAPETRQAVLSSIKATVSKPEFITALSCALDARLATLPAEAPLRQPASKPQLYRQFENGKIDSDELRTGLARWDEARAIKVVPARDKFEKALMNFRKKGLVVFIQRVIGSVSFDAKKRVANIKPTTSKGGVAIE